LIVLDSSGWIDIFTAGPRVKQLRRRVDEADAVLVPTVVIYEVYKIIRRRRTQIEAMVAVTRLREYEVVPLDERIAVEAAEASLRHDLPMADALIYATALVHSATLVTADAHVEHIEGVEYIPADEDR